MAKKKTKKSKSRSLNREDLMQWAKNTLLFSAPALIGFLTALQSGISIEVALGMLYQAFIASSLDLLRKFVAGTK